MGINFKKTQVWNVFLKAKQTFHFSHEHYLNFEKQTLLREEFLHKSIQAHAEIQNQSLTIITSKWTVSNLTKPHVLGYKLFSKRTSTEILTDFRFRLKFEFPLKIWCGEDSVISNSGVPFTILLLFSLRLAVWVNRVKTTRFCIWFVYEYNFHSYCITEKD